MPYKLSDLLIGIDLPKMFSCILYIEWGVFGLYEFDLFLQYAESLPHFVQLIVSSALDRALPNNDITISVLIF